MLQFVWRLKMPRDAALGHLPQGEEGEGQNGLRGLRLPSGKKGEGWKGLSGLLSFQISLSP